MIDPTLPFIDLHRHLDGSVRLETILDLGRKHNLPLPAWDIEGLRPYVQVLEPQVDLFAFLAHFKWLGGVLVDHDACRRVAYENVADARREGIDYIELRFSPWFMAYAHNLQPEGVVEAVVAGIEAGAREHGVRVNLIGILSRTFGPEIAMRELETLLTYKEHIVALDLAGDELHFPAELFVEHFKRGRDAGWQITVHAGEAAGAASVWQAIRLLGATRIGHATRAYEDPALLDYLATNQIGVEVNLTSNVQSSAVSSYASHPLKSYLAHGLCATINTDDPTISGITLAHEFNVAAPAAGISSAEARILQHNALALAFLSPEERAALVARRHGQ